MGILHLEIVTPEKVIISQDVDTVVAPGSEGEFGILPGHIPFLSGIVPGVVRFKFQGTTASMSVTTGFAEISADKVSILVDSAEKAGDIDIERAERAKERAEKRLAERDKEDIDFMRAQIALRRAITRIKVAKKSS
ncbi:MAG: F0F1 ATP synthase subunit epsilon [Deltaproteobacteria bacterium]|nr:F0F1 ATP synthase subunit epsilon [Deltaproteobacteria bacterium]MBW1915246.1 F0F1 ATP synthase subunit epsilon [Deltaproteobacteria bacterium]